MGAANTSNNNQGNSQASADLNTAIGGDSAREMPFSIVVDGAGTSEVNGKYFLDHMKMYGGVF